MTINVDSAQSTIRAAVAKALGAALITGIDNAKDEGHPLTQLQKIDLAVMHVHAYDHAIEACEGLEVEAKLMSTQREQRERRVIDIG